MSDHCPSLANIGCFILSTCITVSEHEAETLEADKNLFFFKKKINLISELSSLNSFLRFLTPYYFIFI